MRQIKYKEDKSALEVLKECCCFLFSLFFLLSQVSTFKCVLGVESLTESVFLGTTCPKAEETSWLSSTDEPARLVQRDCFPSLFKLLSPVVNFFFLLDISALNPSFNHKTVVGNGFI